MEERRDKARSRRNKKEMLTLGKRGRKGTAVGHMVGHRGPGCACAYSQVAF